MEAAAPRAAWLGALLVLLLAQGKPRESEEGFATTIWLPLPADGGGEDPAAHHPLAPREPGVLVRPAGRGTVLRQVVQGRQGVLPLRAGRPAARADLRPAGRLRGHDQVQRPAGGAVAGGPGDERPVPLRGLGRGAGLPDRHGPRQHAGRRAAEGRAAHHGRQAQVPRGGGRGRAVLGEPVQAGRQPAVVHQRRGGGGGAAPRALQVRVHAGRAGDGHPRPPLQGGAEALPARRHEAQVPGQRGHGVLEEQRGVHRGRQAAAARPGEQGQHRRRQESRRHGASAGVPQPTLSLGDAAAARHGGRHPRLAVTPRRRAPRHPERHSERDSERDSEPERVASAHLEQRSPGTTFTWNDVHLERRSPGSAFTWNDVHLERRTP